MDHNGQAIVIGALPNKPLYNWFVQSRFFRV